MKKFKDSTELQEVVERLGLLEPEHEFLEGNAARMSMLGLDQESNGGGPSAQHASDDHDRIGGTRAVQIGEHSLTTGQVNLLVDYVLSLDELAALTAGQLDEGFDLIHAMEHGALSQEDAEAFDSIFKNYSKIALANSDHFGPPSNGLAPAGSNNFLGQIRWYLRNAHIAALNKDTDKALAEAAWGGHFIVDAFSAGHLVNKDEIMERAEAFIFEGDAGTDIFPKASRKIMDMGADKLERWRTPVKLVRFPLLRKIKAGDLAMWLQAAFLGGETRPAVTGAVAKAVHDRLSTDSKGEHERPGLPFVEVTAQGETWFMGGDEQLDDTSETMCARTIDTLYSNLEAIVLDPSHMSLEGLLAEVESSLPKPTKNGQDCIDYVVGHVFHNYDSMATAIAEASVAELDTVLAGINEAWPGWFVRIDGEDGHDEHEHE